jgi:hypothetical protein
MISIILGAVCATRGVETSFTVFVMLVVLCLEYTSILLHSRFLIFFRMFPNYILNNHARDFTE